MAAGPVFVDEEEVKAIETKPTLEFGKFLYFTNRLLH